MAEITNTELITDQSQASEKVKVWIEKFLEAQSELKKLSEENPLIGQLLLEINLEREQSGGDSLHYQQVVYGWCRWYLDHPEIYCTSLSQHLSFHALNTIVIPLGQKAEVPFPILSSMLPSAWNAEIKGRAILIITVLFWSFTTELWLSWIAFLYVSVKWLRSIYLMQRLVVPLNDIMRQVNSASFGSYVIERLRELEREGLDVNELAYLVLTTLIASKTDS